MTLSPRWIYLDFDGVIMDSMALKLDAYAFALAEYGFDREALNVQQRLYAGLSRSRAVPLMFEALAGRPMPEEAQARALRLFGEEDLRLRPRMKLIPGALEFLEEAARREAPLAVVTGTPQEVIDGTVDLFGIRKYFREVHGYAPAKPERLREMLRRHGLRAGEAIYVGDAVVDQRSAGEVGIPFVAVNTGDDPFLPELPKMAEIAALRDLPELLAWK